MNRDGTDYRDAIYRDYPQLAGGAATFDCEAADRWAPCLDYYLRGWLPERRDARIADLGCGDGRLLYLLSKRGYGNLTGVDVSEAQTRIAQQVVDPVLTMNALEWLREGDEPLDLLLAIDFVEHLTKSEALEFLDLCASRLRPGGRLILQTPNGESPFAGAVRHGDITHEQCFTPPLLAALLERAGFHRVETREAGPVPRGYSFRSTLRYGCWRIVRGAFALVNLVETGNTGDGVLTRVFLASAVKPEAE